MGEGGKDVRMPLLLYQKRERERERECKQNAMKEVEEKCFLLLILCDIFLILFSVTLSRSQTRKLFDEDKLTEGDDDVLLNCTF